MIAVTARNEELTATPRRPTPIGQKVTGRLTQHSGMTAVGVDLCASAICPLPCKSESSGYSEIELLGVLLA